MKIIVYVTKSNSILIDPNVTINSGVTNGYHVQFIFQDKWNSELKLYAIFKPANDIPIKLELDENNCCNIPPQLYRRYSKLGIGVKGEHRNEETKEQQATNLFYVPIEYSGI